MTGFSDFRRKIADAPLSFFAKFFLVLFLLWVSLEMFSSSRVSSLAFQSELPEEPTPTPVLPTDTPEPVPTNTPQPIPTATPTCIPVPRSWVIYQVQRGDTLYSLATKRGTTVNVVVAVNCLHTTTIHVGQKLWLPPLPVVPVTATPTIPPPTFTPMPTDTEQVVVSPTPSPTVLPASTPSIAPTATQPEPDTSQATPSPTPQGDGGGLCGSIGFSMGIVAVASVFMCRLGNRQRPAGQKHVEQRKYQGGVGP